MRLLSLMVSLLLMILAFTYCAQMTQKMSEKQAVIKCEAEGYSQKSQEYKDCIEEGSKPLSQRAVEMKNRAQETRKLLDGINQNIKHNLEINN